MPTPMLTSRPLGRKFVRHRTEPERGRGIELARGRGTDRRVFVKWDDGTQQMHDKSSILPEGKTMKVSKSQLRRIIKEAVTGKTLFITHGDYGYIGLKDDAGNEYSLGEIIGELLDTGKALEIFDLNHGAQERAQEKLQTKREQPGAAGPMESWDSDVFDQYYDVDNEKAVHAWAKMNAFTVKEFEGEEGLGDDGDWQQDEYPEQAQASREAAWEEENY